MNELINTVHADIDLMRMRDVQGDVFSERRPVDFVFLAQSEQQASIVAGFLVDYRYANATITGLDDGFRVTATMTMTLEQEPILAVSGFMQCIAAMFSVTYDGWGALIVPRGPVPPAHVE